MAPYTKTVDQLRYGELIKRDGDYFMFVCADDHWGFWRVFVKGHTCSGYYEFDIDKIETLNIYGDLYGPKSNTDFVGRR